MYALETEKPADGLSIACLHETVFPANWQERPAVRLRGTAVPDTAHSFVARDGGDLVGTVRLTWVYAGGQALLLLGPLAVAPSHRNSGLGSALMRRALSSAPDPVILVGDRNYYSRFGFSVAPAGLVLRGEDPDRLLIRLGKTPAPTGVLQCRISGFPAPKPEPAKAR